LDQLRVEVEMRAVDVLEALQYIFHSLVRIAAPRIAWEIVAKWVSGELFLEEFESVEEEGYTRRGRREIPRVDDRLEKCETIR
jgi:hypothetical protein